MQIVIDQNITGVNETFAHHGEVVREDGRTLRREQLAEADALIVRSVTRVNSGLLEHTPVRFVGTTTIGAEHLDTAWLEQNGITWANAPGCNADGAAQYTLAMMLLASRRIGLELIDARVGIVGHGNVGSRLCRLLMALGVAQPLLNDPPLALAGIQGLCELEEIRKCDVISFHVPLSTAGPHATHGMINAGFLRGLRTGALLVNTARGKLIKGDSLPDWLLSGRGFAALDVFPEEPYIGQDLLEACTVATPHVAGYSQDGKMAGTSMIYERFCQWLNVDPVRHALHGNLGMHTLPQAQLATPTDAILACCPVERDDRNLRAIADMKPTERAARFDALRRDYPARRDFAGWLRPPGMPEGLDQTLRNLGFH